MDSIVGNEYLPNAHIEKITYQPFGDFQKAKVVVSVYDYEQRTWSADEKFTGYFSISCFMVWDKETISSLNSGQLLVSNLPVGSSVFKLRAGFSDMERTYVKIRDKNYIRYKKTFSFVVPQNVQDLSCFAISRIELEDLKQNEGLNLSYSALQSYFGSLKSEKIIENNSQITTSVVFRDENDNFWSGPTHRMPSGPLMAGSQHGEIAENSLTSETFSSNKIEYLEEVIIPLQASMVSGPLDNINTKIDLSTISIFPQAVYNQQEFIEDNTRNVSSTTIADMENILLQESRVAQIMYQYNKDLFAQIVQATNIKNIEINRFPILKNENVNRFNMLFFTPDYSQPTLVARSNNNHRKIKNKTLYKISPTEIVSLDPQSLSNNKSAKIYNGKNLTLDMIKNAIKIGKVEQLNLTLEKNLRAINFTDYSIKFEKEGKYKYQIKLSIEDEHLKYCKNLLKDLLMSQNKIQNLYNILVMKNVFNGDQFDIDFLQEFYSQYNVQVDTNTGFVGEINTEQLLNSYLIKSFEFLSIAERLVGTTPQAANMINNLNLFLTDLDKIQNTSDYFKTIIDLFKTIYDLSDGETFDKSSTKSRKDRGIIAKTINLKKDYQRKLFQPVGINFISMEKTDGIPFINILDFQERSNKEVKKFFSSQVNNDSNILANLPENVRNSMTDLEEKKYVNFSPSMFFMGDKEINATEITPQSFDADFFNDIRIAKSAAQFLENKNDSDFVNPENLIDEDKIEKYLDSREILGDASKFNNLVVSSLLKKPKMFSKVRKKFKFFDNKVLKSTKKSISLKTFDLKQPNNNIFNKLKEDPKNIPIQIKALTMLKSPMTNFDLDSIEFDPLSNPQTQEVFQQNYLNIGKIEVLEGFERINGVLMMNKPIYKEINAKMLNSLSEKNVLCRISPVSFEGLTENQEFFNVHDKVFMLNSVNRDQINTQQLSQTNESPDIPMPEQSPEKQEANLIYANYNNLSPVDYSNTIIDQNESNASVVSIFPLVQDQPQAEPIQEIQTSQQNILSGQTRGTIY